MSDLGRSRIALAAVAIAAAASTVALALAPFGGATAETSGASLKVSGVVDDHGTEYKVDLGADESTSRAGEGSVSLFLGGPSLSLCTTHGPTAEPDSFPLAQVQCGGAGSQAVSITGCRAGIEAHGFSHSDFPQAAVHLGSVTVDVAFEKRSPTSGVIDVKIYTPKTKIDVAGRLIATDPIFMSTCP